MWAGLRPQEPSHWSGRDRNLRSKILTPSSLTRSLLSARNRALLETWSYSKGALAFNI